MNQSQRIMESFRRGDNRSRSSAWTKRIAERLKRFALRHGLDADFTSSAWGSQYLTVEAVAVDDDSMIQWTESLTIRIANHVWTGSGMTDPDVDVHNETPESAREGPKRAEKAIKELAAKMDRVLKKNPDWKP